MKPKYKWLETKYRVGVFIVTKHLCSNCAMSIDMVDYPDGLPNKCPNCGARMDLQPLKCEVEE